MDWVLHYWVEMAFSLMLALLAAIYKHLSSKLKKYAEETHAVKDGMQALLRDRIIQAYNYYTHEAGACPMYAMDSVLAMYNAYHALGGNGTIDNLMEDMRELPTQRKESA